MRKPNVPVMVLIPLLFVFFVLGFFFGMNQRKSSITVSVSKEILTKPLATSQLEEENSDTEVTADNSVIFPISINHAGKDALAALPGIGESLAQRIIDYRKMHGRFTSVDDLLNVEGIGRKRLDDIRDLIVIGG